MNDLPMKRRDFIALGLTASAALTLTGCTATPEAASIESSPASLTAIKTSRLMDIPDDGWRLWLDKTAPWRHDRLYLPDEVDLEKLPINPPTGGWQMLSDEQGIAVTLPGTVEQHFWGVNGLPYYTTNEYFFAWDDREVRCGGYFGVSWWWTRFQIPDSFAGKKLLLRFRGARQRAEVFLNERLIGYDLIDQTAFTCDATAAARPGRDNILAVRITNPGGRYDWVDTRTIAWSNGRFQRSHGFGGIDRGIVLEAHDPVYMNDLWVLNTPEPRTISIHAQLTNDLPQTIAGRLRVSVLDTSGNRVAVRVVRVNIPTGPGHIVRIPLDVPAAQLWDLDTPVVYTLLAEFQSDQGTIHDVRDTTFGFRWFEADGIGSDAMLKLNGRRIRLHTAISWGFWGLNGLWPTPELARKEVLAAKALGMNCLNFHRQIGREQVLHEQDWLGLLRYMEVGGGEQFASEPADGFEARFMTEKLLRMFRQFRSHPSLIMYCIQNEWSPNLKNPRILEMLKRLHAEDPSRIVTLKDGIVPQGEAWYRAGTWKLHEDHGNGFSGWWCQHTAGGGAGSWEDQYYRGPDRFMYHSDIRRQIVEWGEVGGSAVADNHELMVRQIQAAGGKSYDLLDHEQILAAYEHFLDRWQFRKAFPTASALFEALGVRCYQWWSILLENFRIAERVDMCAMSGWESTAIENHSGIVDNLRNHKGPPELIARSLAPAMPLAKLRQLVVKRGDAAIFDLYFINDTGRAVSGEVRVSMQAAERAPRELLRSKIPAYVQNRCVYPLAQACSTGPLDTPGPCTLRAELEADGLCHERTILVVDEGRLRKTPVRIGLIGTAPDAARRLEPLPDVHIEPFNAHSTFDCLLLGNGPMGRVIKTDRHVTGSPIPWLFTHQCVGEPGEFKFTFNALPDQPIQVTLYFAEIEHRAAGRRIFDVAINGRVVLKSFDIFAQAGGADRALERQFKVTPVDGSVVIDVPNVEQGRAAFAGIKIYTPQRTVTAYFGPGAIKQHLGPAELIWKPYQTASDIPAAAVERVRKGTGLAVVTDNEFFSDTAAGMLSRLGCFEYHGHVGSLRSNDNWMGNWIFVREHPLYAGLPVNCAMKDDYQVPFFNANGLLIDGEHIEVAAGYSRDHDRNIGAATFTARLGTGKIVYHMMPPMQKIVEHRWLVNMLNELTA